MVEAFHAIVELLTAALQAFHGLTGSYLAAITLLTAAIRLVLHPLTRKSLNSMKAMQALAPQMEVLRRKYKEDPRQLNVEVMNLYRANKANPMGGCLPMVLQLPVLWALYAVLRQPQVFRGETLFGVPLESQPWPLDVFLQHPLLVLIPLLTVLTTYWQQQMSMSVSMTDPQQARMILIFMPLMLAYFSTQFPIGMSVYWIVSTALYVLEYYIILGPPRRLGVAPPRDQRSSPKAKRTARSGETP